jgi:hypothetical protein
MRLLFWVVAIGCVSCVADAQQPNSDARSPAATGQLAPQRAGVPPPPPREPHHTFYYRPGENKGIPYETIEECTKASQQAGNVGICVMK